MTLHCTVNCDVLLKDTRLFTSVGSSQDLAPANFTYTSGLWYFCPWHFGTWEQFDCLHLAVKVGIRFENVQFAYQSRPDKKAWCGVRQHEIKCRSKILHQVLMGITLDIRAGKTTAIVGKSGCGKSTMSNSTSQGLARNCWKYITGKVFRVKGGVIFNHIQSVWMIFYPR